MISSKIIVLVLFLNLANGEAKNTNNSCTNGNCDCLNSLNKNIERKINCPSFMKFWVEITHKPSEKLVVQCFNNFTHIDDLEFNFGQVPHVEFEDCILKNNLSVFEKWNLTNVKNLILKRSFDVNSTGVLRKDFFEKIEKRTFENIHIESCGYETIEENVFDGFTNLVRIDIERNPLKEVYDIFKYSPNLKHISLHSNQIRTIPFGITAPKLEKLYLNVNKFVDLNENMFLNCPNIRLLELSANQIKKLPERILHNLKNLTFINFGFGGEISLTNIFEENDKLESIRFRDGNVTLTLNSFKNLLNLKSLIIYNSKLRQLPTNLFSNTPNIEFIKISESDLTSLPDGIFSDLNNLETLDLSGNKLVEWKYEFYAKSLPKLKTLTLNKNELSVIDRSAFLNLPTLETLSLSFNKITRIMKEAFDMSNNNLRKLELNNNNLSQDDDNSFNYLTKLTELNLNNNSYREFPNVNILTSLQVEIKYNKVEKLNLLDILALTKIDLTGNSIKKIDNFKIFSDHLTNGFEKRTLILNENPIWCDCGAHDLLTWIENDRRYPMIVDNLKCSHPPNLSSRYIKNITVQDLYCSFRSNNRNNAYNCPESCSCFLYPVNSTFKIDCSALNLKEPPNLGVFINKIVQGIEYTNLSIDLSRNKIENFDESTDYLNVTGLDLSRNSLKVISWVPDRLKFLDLNSNQLKTLDNKVLTQLKNSSSLETLNLNENPWNCDCSLINLTYATRTSFQNILKSPENSKCSDGRLLIHLTKVDLCSQIDIFTTILVAIATFFIIISAILTVLYFKHETTVKIWLYSHNILLKYVTEQDVDKQKKFDAFVSYSHKDESFILEHLIPELEGGSQQYKLCYHERDWEVGEFINRQIIDSVASSRRTIIVLSKNFLESTWAAVEFRTAHTQAMNEKLNRLIVILYDDITPDDVEDEELRTYLKTTTYIKWGDPWFWKKLKYAMPHRMTSGGKRKQDEKVKQKIENVMIAIDDKLDLTKGGTITPNTQTPPAMALDPLLLKMNPLEFKPDKQKEDSFLSTHIC